MKHSTSGLWAAVLLVAGIAIASALYWEAARDRSVSVQHTYNVLMRIDAIRSDLQDAETAGRGYFLSGRLDLMAPLHAASRRLPDDLLALRALVSDNPRQLQNLELLEPLALRKLDLMAHAADIRRIKSLQETMEATSRWPGAEVMDQARRVLIDMEAEETHLLSLRTRQADRARLTLLAVQMGGSVVLLVLVGASTLGITREIHSRREAEANLRAGQAEVSALNSRLRRAMAETHHRVKNNLQVIAGLVDLQAMDAPEMVPLSGLKRIGQHVLALAAVHDILTAEAKATGTAEYVGTREIGEKLRPLLAGLVGGNRLHFNVDDVRLPIRQATSLTVLMNELIANAVKHGAGDIHLSLSAKNGAAELLVRDHGSGFPPDFDPRSSANTGLELIHSLSTWDLGGKVDFQNAPDGGASVAITFPVAPPGTNQG